MLYLRTGCGNRGTDCVAKALLITPVLGSPALDTVRLQSGSSLGRTGYLPWNPTSAESGLPLPVQ